MNRLAAAMLPALLICAPVSAPSMAAPLDDALRSVVSVMPVWPGRPPDAEEPEGSGVVIDDGQWIVTAAHVLADAKHVQVRDADGTVMTATPGPRSDATDLALLRIEKPLPAMAWPEAQPGLGDEVCALGNAFGLGLTVTCGVVSAIDRTGAGFNAIEGFVQTDAAVNPGMSGGALVTRDGNLAGILSAIFTKRSDANIGVNFAVSAELTRVVTDRLIGEGAFRPATSGMTLRASPPRGETGVAAARVVAVVDDGPAALAGIVTGDRIRAAGGRRIGSAQDMRLVLALAARGEPLTLVIDRDGKELELQLVPR